MIHKYRASSTIIDWIKFSSKLESRFYQYFIDIGIEILELQPRFILQEKFELNGEKIRAIEYVSDFKIKHQGDVFYVDSKGFLTPEFKIKLKLWKKIYWQDNYLIIAKSIKDLEKQLELNTILNQ